jgi:membrane protease YdiL (CAAX protease family)
MLFRGALTPWLGVWLQAAIFALLHIGPGKRFVPWTIFAALLGVALGYLAMATGNLAGVIIAHFVINALNLRQIMRDDSPTMPLLQRA